MKKNLNIALLCTFVTLAFSCSRNQGEVEIRLIHPWWTQVYDHLPPPETNDYLVKNFQNNIFHLNEIYQHAVDLLKNHDSVHSVFYARNTRWKWDDYNWNYIRGRANIISFHRSTSIDRSYFPVIRRLSFNRFGIGNPKTEPTERTKERARDIAVFSDHIDSVRVVRTHLNYKNFNRNVLMYFYYFCEPQFENIRIPTTFVLYPTRDTTRWDVKLHYILPSREIRLEFNLD